MTTSHETVRAVIAGGGTGGHLFPGLAVAREMVRQEPDTVVTFVGTARGIEVRVVPREGFELDVIRSAGLKGKSLAERVRGLLLLPLSAWDSWRIITRRRPDVVVGVGGYSSGPVVGLAALRGVPTLVLEPNAMPGLANRLLGRLVDAAAVTYEEALRYFGGRGFVSGNPVRAGFLAVGEATDSAAPESGQRHRRLLVFGGSQGAHAINVAMAEAARRLAAVAPPIEVTHQTGERDLEMVRTAYEQARLTARVSAFIDEMDREMGRADLVVCRAGATTLAEVTAAGRAALLIPLPTATDDHQRRNAEALASRGAAEMLDQGSLTGERLAEQIAALLDDDDRRRRLATNARAAARPEAAEVIAGHAFRLARRAA